MRERLCRELTGLLDLFFPPVCLLCDVPLSSGERDFCCSCRSGIHPLQHPLCPICALPLAPAGSADHRCAACLVDPPAYDWTVAGGLYEATLREAVQAFKFDKRISLDAALTRLISARWQAEPPPWLPDLIIPVPLHRRRLRERTYNQALLLARCLGRTLRRPVAARRLLRTEATLPQPGLSARARLANLHNAFTVQHPFADEKILLVDDVMTSGATVRTCAATLRAAGAGAIGVAVLARARRNPLPTQVQIEE